MISACKSTNWKSSVAISWKVWEECDPAWGDHFIWSRYWVSFRFCQNSFRHFYQPPCAPEEKFLVEIGKENPVGVLEQLFNGDHGETDEDAGREIHIEGEDVDVVCGAPALAISKFELQGFIFS